MTISVIIPTYNEAENIVRLIQHLQSAPAHFIAEIIVTDGGSTDATTTLAATAGATVLHSPKKGRAAQMNWGATHATGTILYFVHADTLPPVTFAADVIQAVNNGAALGRYRTKFDSNKLLLQVNAWFTRFDFFICMGGDQTLFVTKAIFEKAGRFNEGMTLMEEYEFCTRARTLGRYKILKGHTLISARKYQKNSWLQVQRANYTVVKMYKKGAPQQQLVATYKRMLQW